MVRLNVVRFQEAHAKYAVLRDFQVLKRKQLVQKSYCLFQMQGGGTANVSARENLTPMTKIYLQVMFSQRSEAPS